VATDSRGYLLPENAQPPDTVCLKVYIPNDPLYLREFWDAYSYFTQWSAWKRDPLKRGKDAARVWLKAYDQAREEYILRGGCPVAITNLRQNPLDPCKLEFSEDGVTWTEFANLKDCGGGGCGDSGVLRVTNGVVQRYDPCDESWRDAGPVTPTTGHGGDGVGSYEPGPDVSCLAATNISHVLTTGISATIAVLIAEANLAQLANALAAAFATITPGFEWYDAVAVTFAEILLSYSGSWSDVNDYDIEDDVTLIMQPYIDDDGSITAENWHNINQELIAKGESYTLFSTENVKWALYNLATYVLGPQGLVKAEKLGGLTEGSCGAGSWTHTFDFMVSRQGWFAVGFGYTPTANNYVTGQGWKPAVAAGGGSNTVNGLGIKILLPSIDVTSVKMIYDATPGDLGSAPAYAQVALSEDVGEDMGEEAIQTGTARSFEWTGTRTVTSLFAMVIPGYHIGGGLSDEGSAILRKIIVRGTGDNPFA